MNIKEFNLLSPGRRVRLGKLIRFLFVKELLEFVMFGAAILAIAHIFGWLILVGTLQNLVNSSLLVGRETPPFTEEIREINKLTNNIKKAGKDYVPTTPLVLDVVRTLPPGVRLVTFDLDMTEKTLVLTGVATTRQDLLGYQETLKEIEWVKSVKAPASQLFEKENLSFEIRAEVRQNNKK
jgi:Tfp pilus assembly protein PilN